jgi:hypothetical protein
LHLVLDWAEHHAFVVGEADFEAFGGFDERGEEGRVLAGVDVDSFGCNADLGGVEEGALK